MGVKTIGNDLDPDSTPACALGMPTAEATTSIPSFGQSAASAMMLPTDCLAKDNAWISFSNVWLPKEA